MMTKPCQMCGKPIECKDNRRKYCDECRAVRKHFFDQNALQKLRETTRERRKEERKQLAQQTERIKFLEGIIVKQQRQIKELENIIKTYNI